MTQEPVEQWYEEHGETVFTYVLMLVGDYQQAEDITQETFVKAYRKHGTFKYQSSIKTWLFSIAQNTAKDHFRKTNPFKHYLNLTFNERDHSPLPHQLLEINDRDLLLYQTLQNLKPAYRQVILLRMLKEFSTKETAEILNWSESKVKSTLARGLNEFKNELEKGGFEYEASI